MILYHGSTMDIEQIDLTKSKPNKDFGRAFYLSVNKEQAMEMAQFKAEFEDKIPVVNAYEFDEALLQQLRYKHFDDYTEEWAHFVYNHRTEPNGRTLHDYDVVFGPIANDRCTDYTLQTGLYHIRRIPSSYSIHQGHNLPIRLLHSKGHRQTDKTMNVSQAEFQNMKEEIVKDLISRLMEERGMTMQKAFDLVYASHLFEKLSNPKTGLYFQSSGYAYDFLLDEIGRKT